VAGTVRRLIEAHARREVGAGAEQFQLATDPSFDHVFYPVPKVDAQGAFRVARADPEGLGDLL
jgi:hypothetical protein